MSTAQTDGDERWARLFAELRENQTRAQATPTPRIPRFGLAITGVLLFVLFYYAGGILLIGPTLKQILG